MPLALRPQAGHRGQARKTGRSFQTRQVPATNGPHWQSRGLDPAWQHGAWLGQGAGAPGRQGAPTLVA